MKIIFPTNHVQAIFLEDDLLLEEALEVVYEAQVDTN
jgi:hypothetical protein